MEQEGLEPMAELSPEELEVVAGGGTTHTGIGRSAGTT